jgi:hypothetical protein
MRPAAVSEDGRIGPSFHSGRTEWPRRGVCGAARETAKHCGGICGYGCIGGRGLVLRLPENRVGVARRRVQGGRHCQARPVQGHGADRSGKGIVYNVSPPGGKVPGRLYGRWISKGSSAGIKGAADDTLIGFTISARTTRSLRSSTIRLRQLQPPFRRPRRLQVHLRQLRHHPLLGTGGGDRRQLPSRLTPPVPLHTSYKNASCCW